MIPFGPDEVIGVIPGLSDMSPDEEQALMRLLGEVLERLLDPSDDHSAGARAG